MLPVAETAELTFLVRLPDAHASAPMAFDVSTVDATTPAPTAAPTATTKSCSLVLLDLFRGAKHLAALSALTYSVERSTASPCARDGSLLPGRYSASAIVDGKPVVSTNFTVE